MCPPPPGHIGLKPRPEQFSGFIVYECHRRLESTLRRSSTSKTETGRWWRRGRSPPNFGPGLYLGRVSHWFSQGWAIWGYGDHGNPDNDNDDDEWLLIISLSQGKQHDEPTEPQGAERPPGEIHRQHWDASWESTPHYHQVVTVIITTVIIK